MCVHVRAHTCAQRSREGGNEVTPLKLILILLFDEMAGCSHACSHTQLHCFDKPVPHRHDFKGNFQAPSFPSPDKPEQGRGEPGGSGDVMASAAGGTDTGTAGSSEILFCMGMDIRTGSCLVFVCQGGGRDPCAPVLGEKEASVYPQLKKNDSEGPKPALTCWQWVLEKSQGKWTTESYR